MDVKTLIFRLRNFENKTKNNDVLYMVQRRFIHYI